MIANRITLNADPCHPYTPAYVGLYENVFTRRFSRLLE